MNQLRWQPWTAPGPWQPYPTVFQLAHEAGVRAAQVSSPTFANTPLTKVALSGGTFHGRLSGEDRMDCAAEQLAGADRALVYTYYAEVDGAGHRFGVDSDTWRGQLGHVDRLVQRLAEQLPPRSAPVRHRRPRHDRRALRRGPPHRLRRRLGAEGGRRPPRRRGPRPARLRRPRRGERRADLLARGARRAVLGGVEGRGGRGGLVRPPHGRPGVRPHRRRGRRRAGRRPAHRLRAGSRRSRRWSATTGR